MPVSDRRALTESAALLESLLGAAPVGLGVLDRELRFVRMNEALAAVLGVHPDGHLGRGIEEVWPAVPAELLERLRAVAERGEVVLDRPIEHGGRTAVASCYPVLAGGAIAGVGIVCADVTEERLAAEALSSSERRLRELLHNVQLLAISVDLEGRITNCNPFVESLTGWSRDELVGRDWYEVFPLPELRIIRDNFRRELATDTVMPYTENPILTSSGEPRMIAWEQRHPA